MKLFKKFISILICLNIVTGLCSCNKKTETPSIEPENEIFVLTEEINVSQVAGYTAHQTDGSQVGILVDSWLKIISIGERDGILSVFVRNTADFDVQYVVLTVNAGGETAQFSVSTLTAGTSAVLTCENAVEFEPDMTYHSWKVSDKVIFDKKLLRYTDIFQINGIDDVLSVKNISDKDIKGKIYVYYKTVTDGIYAEGTTYRVSIDGLEKGETVQVQAQHYQKDVSRIMFVTYAE